MTGQEIFKCVYSYEAQKIRYVENESLFCF